MRGRGFEESSTLGCNFPSASEWCAVSLDMFGAVKMANGVSVVIV